MSPGELNYNFYCNFSFLTHYYQLSTTCVCFYTDLDPEARHYSEGTDDGNESAFSIYRKWPLSTYAHGYCHGSQNLENLNLHINLCHFWIILTTYKWSNELAAQNYIFTPFGGLFVTMYTRFLSLLDYSHYL